MQSNMRLRRWCRKPVANENITREFFGSPHCCKVPNVLRLQDSSRQSAPNITPQYFRGLFSVNCLRYAANVLTQLTTIDDHERHRLFPVRPHALPTPPDKASELLSMAISTSFKAYKGNMPFVLQCYCNDFLIAILSFQMKHCIVVIVL